MISILISHFLHFQLELMCVVLQFSKQTTTYGLKVSLCDVFPWLEYIVRCGWLPDGKR